MVHLTSVHRPYDTRIFVKMCSSLASAGHDVHLVVASREAVSRDGVVIHRLPEPKNRAVRMLFTSWAVWARALRLRPDILHFHDPELIFGALALRAMGKKVVIDLHEDLPMQVLTKHWIPGVLRRPVAAVAKSALSFAAARMSGIVTATQPISDSLRSRSTVVRNLPDVAEFKVPGPDYSSRERVVTYIGGLNPNRGLYEMLEASLLVDPPARFELGGPFEPLELEQEVAKHPGMSHTSLLGFLSRDEVKGAMDRARVGLVVLRPNKNYLESQPVKMYEYMAAGIPVIASNFPVWREIVDGYQCGLTVDPTDSAAIARAVEWILEHPREAEQMGHNGRAAVLGGLEWASQFTALERLYESVVAP